MQPFKVGSMKTLVISTINLKGGSGKTSTILNLGSVIHESGRKPLLIDMDPQQSAFQWAQQGGGKFPYPVETISGGNVKGFKVKLDQLKEKYKANTILFDTPPQIQNEAMIAALMSDLVLIPITPSPLDIWACQVAIKTVREAQVERGSTTPKIILIPSRVMPKTILGKDLGDTLKQFNEPISPSITLRVAMAEAAIAGLPVSLYDPEGVSHNEFRSLFKFVLSNIRK